MPGSAPRHFLSARDVMDTAPLVGRHRARPWRFRQGSFHNQPAAARQFGARAAAFTSAGFTPRNGGDRRRLALDDRVVNMNRGGQARLRPRTRDVEQRLRRVIDRMP